MIDAKDKQTLDVFKKRGRPALKGAPMSAAERKRRQRAKAAIDFREAQDKKKPFNELSLTALFHELQWAVRLGHVEQVKIINAELLKRSKHNQDEKRDGHKKG